MRVVAALTTMPDGRAWRRCALVYGVFLLCAAPVGFFTEFLRVSVTHAVSSAIAATALLTLIHPAFVEELIFRVVLLPRDPRAMPRGRLVLVSALALALYVASHPLNAIVFRPEARAVFERPAYLVIVTLLGGACTAAYWISRSIWPPVVMHWLSVIVWLNLLGGEALLSARIPRT